MEAIDFQGKDKIDWLIVHFDSSIVDENKNCINHR